MTELKSWRLGPRTRDVPVVRALTLEDCISATERFLDPVVGFSVERDGVEVFRREVLPAQEVTE